MYVHNTICMYTIQYVCTQYNMYVHNTICMYTIQYVCNQVESCSSTLGMSVAHYLKVPEKFT